MTTSPKPGTRSKRPPGRAISPKSGQIAVDPVTDLGGSSYLIVPIGTDTPRLSQDGFSTKWIGVNTGYLTLETQTTNFQATTSTIHFLLETAGASQPERSGEASALLVPSKLATSLQNVASAVSKSQW
ncbi:hypothetical protein MMC10_003013 [Thelotrema lepadinum]|nr:hypothetical protein [Thelotrema lepadinum]